MRKKNVISIIIALLIPVSIVAFFTYGGNIKDWIILKQRNASLPPAISYEEAVISNTDGTDQGLITEKVPPPVKEEATILITLPSSINLDVPFTSQAPHANWDLPYQEACEEASVLMVAKYKKGEKINSKDQADKELLQLIEFENSFLGFYKDTTAEETARFAKEYYGFSRSRVIYEFNVDTIKRELAAGNPVIVPAAGRQLGNPYFTSPGPLYHMLVIRGYTADGRFITNDPGTRRGEGYVYQYNTIINAIHDWNGGDVENGQKAIIVLE